DPANASATRKRALPSASNAPAAWSAGPVSVPALPPADPAHPGVSRRGHARPLSRRVCGWRASGQHEAVTGPPRARLDLPGGALGVAVEVEHVEQVADGRHVEGTFAGAVLTSKGGTRCGPG